MEDIPILLSVLWIYYTSVYCPTRTMDNHRFLGAVNHPAIRRALAIAKALAPLVMGKNLAEFFMAVHI